MERPSKEDKSACKNRRKWKTKDPSGHRDDLQNSDAKVGYQYTEE